MSGDQRAAVVFVHGNGLNGSSGGALERFFTARGHAWAAPDLPGHGDCPPVVTDDFTLDTLVGVLASTIELHRFERPIVAGHSLGAMVALEYAARRPERVAGLLLLGATDVDPRREGMPGVAAVVEKLLADSAARFESQRRVAFDAIGAVSDAALLELGLRFADPAALRSNYRAASAFDVRGRLSNVIAPVLVLAASHDTIAGPPAARRLVAQLPRGRVVEVGGGHNWHLQSPSLCEVVLRTHYAFLTGASP